MSNKVKIRDKKRVNNKVNDDLLRTIKDRFPSLDALYDLLRLDGGGMVRIREGFEFKDVPRGGFLHMMYIDRLEDELGRKISIDLLDKLRNK